MTLKGYIDVRSPDLVCGWVWDSDEPTRRVLVEIWAGDNNLGRLVAEAYRSDLEVAGKGDGRYAFSYEPSQSPRIDEKEIFVVVAGTDYRLPLSLPPGTDPSLEVLFTELNQPLEIHNHRDIRAGRFRGAHLEFTFEKVIKRISADPIWQHAWALVEERRTLVSTPKLVNLYLILRYALAPPHECNVIEFGSYRGGSALFMASVLRDLGRKSKVFALDTYDGMPATDPVRDSHNPGDFADCDYAGFQAQATRNTLDDHLQTTKGRFEDTLPDLLSSGTKFALAHVDCDIYSAVTYVVQAVKPAMQPGGYIIFDDPLHGSCLGAFDAVVDTLILEDRLHPEQVYPHMVFRYPPLE